jgi:uncharacterized protein YdcH (DUF465 family)
VADLHQHFDEIKERFGNIDDRLTNIEQRGQSDDAAAAAKSEVDAKKDMEEAGQV